jgi:Holliday junction DNA helicase RuvA
MIGKLKGVVDAVGPEEVVIDVGGVGYLVACGGRTLARLPAPGETVSLFIETRVREDEIRLFGFMTEEERAWFARLQQIQGVGAKVSLAVLDVLSPGELMNAASIEDQAAVSRAHGVGARLAARIVTELKDKPAPATRFAGRAGAVGKGASRPNGAGVVTAAAIAEARPASDDEYRLRADAVSALVNLGLNEPDVRAAVTNARTRFDALPSLDALVKAALKEIGR